MRRGHTRTAFTWLRPRLLATRASRQVLRALAPLLRLMVVYRTITPYIHLPK